MTEWAMKRFWETTSVETVSGGFGLRLDGRGVKTPAKAPLVVPTRAMADAIAAEWDAQTDKVQPQTMPFTRSANAAIDKVSIQRAEVAEMLAAYGDSDLTCYRADAPEGLVERQAAAWDPLLDWLDATHGVRLIPRIGVIHAPQDVAALSSLSPIVHGYDPFRLTALHDLISLTGSLVIGLAAAEGHSTPAALWDASRIDETWQEEQWGQDDEATEHAQIKRDAFLHAVRFLGCCEAQR